MMNSDCVKSWPKNERPRERLLSEGAEKVSDADLLADFRGVATLKLLDVSFGPSWDIERSVVSCGWDKTQEKVDVEFTLEVTEKWGVFGIGPWSSQFSFSQYSMGKGTASHLGPCCCKEE